jgi:hypothetical protein
VRFQEICKTADFELCKKGGAQFCRPKIFNFYFLLDLRKFGASFSKVENSDSFRFAYFPGSGS